MQVVFGIKDVHRNYDTSHVLPEDGDENSAVLDPGFHSLFTYPFPSDSTNSRLTGAVRALCRICANVSNPDNGLALEGNYQCVPASSRDGYMQSVMAHLSPIAAALPECGTFLNYNSENRSVYAGGGGNRTAFGISLLFLAMSFKSTTNPGDSPFKAVQDYQKWTDFLSAELSAIRAKSSPGDLYEGAADSLSSAFHTSENWVQVNVEASAVYGSFYGIILSFVLCSIVVVLLAHDFRVVVSMVVTIVAILISLGGLFWCFSWKLGIVEAISLSILVGNSLDYCIHLSEGYVAMDARHLAFVERFRIVAKAPVRVKRVMTAISFIGVSILSSAITTILAILPLVGTHIKLFTRFGEILLLDTAVAIVYTLLICSNCLGFFGPPLNESRRRKVVNAVVTIFSVVGFYVLLLLVLFIASRCGVYIPSPQGGQLFG